MKSTDSYKARKAGLAENTVTLAGIVVLISGLLVIIGWQKNIVYLQTFLFGPVAMKANLGAGFFLIGLNIILLRFRGKKIFLVAKFLSVLVFAIGLITVFEFILGVGHGFDEILFRGTYLAGDFTGSTRMALNAAISLVFSGVVLFLLADKELRYTYFTIFSLVFTFSVSLFGLTGFILGMAEFTGATGYRDMAVLATVLFILSSVAQAVILFNRGKLRISVEQKLFSVLVLVGIATIFLTLLSVSGFMSIRTVSSSVESTQVIKNELNELLGEINSVETGVGSYLINGDKEYLGPVKKALPGIRLSLDSLHYNFMKDTTQLHDFLKLQSLIFKRIKHADSIVRIIDSNGKNAAVAYFISNREKVVNERIKALIDTLRYEENRKLLARNAVEAEHSHKAQMIAYINLPVLLLLLIIIFIFIRRNIVQRRKALDEVKILNDRLETRVKERTASLSRNEERFRSTLDNMLEGCQIISFDYKYLYVNREVEKQAKTTASVMLGKSMNEIYPGIEDTKMFRNLKWSMEKRQQHLMLNEFTYPDGSKGWFELNMQPVPEGLVIFSQDMTEKRNAENSLKESEEKFRSITENSADAIFITDENGKYIFVNKASETLLGYSQQEMLFMTIANLSPPGMEKDHLMIFRKILERGKFRTEIGLLAKDGRTVYADLNAVILPGGMVFGSCRDISETKKNREELDKYRLHLEELIAARTAELNRAIEETSDLYENAPCGYHSLDVNGRIIRINNTEVNWLGYTKEELVNKKTFTELLTGSSVETFRDNFPKFKKTGYINNLEFELIRKDGSTFFISLNGTAVYDSSGNYMQSRSTLFDITERKMSEIALKQARKTAEEANRAKSEFLANMSHEIRTPMNAVLGYTDLLAHSITDENLKNYVNSIKTSGKSLLTLINDILDLSKIEAGKLELEFGFVESKLFFAEFERIFSHKISEKGLQFLLDITSGTPSGIYIDEARLRQIVFNLLGNAVKFTNKGVITLRVLTQNPRLVEYSEARKENVLDLIIEVEDTGIGISTEQQRNVFEPFIQGDNFKQHTGTGLGLAISRRLVSLMDGSIKLESEKGKGSKFTVLLPGISYRNEYSTVNNEITLNPADVVFNKASILVVDDIEHNRNYLQDALKETGIKVYTAAGGIPGLKLARKIHPDLIVADIRMPGMDGFQLLKKVKEDPGLKDVPVLAYSASVLKTQKERIYKSDFVGLLMKPVNITDLYLTLMNILPYRTKNEIEHDFESHEEKNLNEIIDLLGLIKSLESDFLVRWNSFSTTQPLDDIKNFGKDLIQLGENHNASIITSYGKAVLNAAERFNIPEMLKLIEKFKSLLDSIEKH